LKTGPENKHAHQFLISELRFLRGEIYRRMNVNVTPARTLQSFVNAMRDEEWRENLVTTSAGIRDVLESAHRIAVLGMKCEPDRPAYFVPEYAKMSGYEIIPVPVYYPGCMEIMGEKVYRKIADVPGEVDIVNVFRRPGHIPPHVDDIIAKKPKAVWFQSGIRNDAAAERLARAGIRVVQDRCLMVELRRIGR
jgi:hypothetical protein